MKSVVVIEVEHDRPIPRLANLVAGRAWTIQGVTRAEPMRAEQPGEAELLAQGFTHAEIALGNGEVVRGA